MGWMGKFVGGTIGFALGGPLGAIAGAAFGHAFDAGDGNYAASARQRLTTGETSQLTFFVAAFSMLAKLARADGQITREEIATVDNFLVHDLNLNPESRHVAMNIFQTALDSPETFEQFAAQFYDQFRDQPQLLEMMVDILLRVAVADGQFAPAEERLLLNAVGIFNFGQERYLQLKSRYIKDLDKYYAVLHSSRSDPDDAIKTNYRKLVAEYHPDKIASKGLPEEFTQLANDKFREIQEAYENVKQERGIK